MHPPTSTTARSPSTGQLRRLHGSLDAGARAAAANANAKAKERIAELQTFVRRFSANASKAKQATSRLKLIDKIKPEDIKPSSRQYPWIRFEYDEKEKLHARRSRSNGVSHAFRRRRALFAVSRRPSMPVTASPSSARTASARRRCCAAWLAI